MFTICPKCTLTLAVTANDLRAGQGYVRCGRCSNVFNALLKLTEAPSDSDATPPSPPQAVPASSSQITQALLTGSLAAPPPAAPSAAPATPPAAQAGADALPDRTQAHGTNDDAIDRFERVLETLGIDLAEDEPVTAADEPARAASKHPPEGNPPQARAAPGSRTFESIVLEGDGITQTEEILFEAPVDEPVDELDLLTRRLDIAIAAGGAFAQPPAQARQASSRGRAGRGRDGVVDARGALEALSDPPSADGEEPRDAAARPAGVAEPDPLAMDPMDLDFPGRRSAAPGRRWAWLIGCLLLAPLLGLQAANHWRDALAASPTWGAAVTRIYAALGVPLNPHWDLLAYDVRQEGAQSDPGADQVIRVRLSLANHAQRAQPVPLLRLTLLDRYGKRVAQRDLAPADYWPKGRAPQSFMASDERIDSEVVVRDPSADSASFELDVCLRDASGVTHCAGDATATAATAGVP